MDCVPVTLQPTEEAEGEDAHGQTDEGYNNAHTTDDAQQELLDFICTLRNKQTEMEAENLDADHIYQLSKL